VYQTLNLVELQEHFFLATFEYLLTFEQTKSFNGGGRQGSSKNWLKPKPKNLIYMALVLFTYYILLVMIGDQLKFGRTRMNLEQSWATLF